MIEGENVKWSSMFKGIAGQLGKAGMERTESSLAKLLGFGGKSKTKNLGTSSNPMYVKVMSLPGGGPGGSGGSTGNQGGMGGLLGAIAGNGKSHSTGFMGFLRNMLGTNGAIQSLNLGPGTIDPLGAAPNVDVSGMAGDPMAGLNSIFSHAANGGDVTAGASYDVGEMGRETFVPTTNGKIVPNHKLGGNQAYYTIDARGSDAAEVERRVQRSLTAVHGHAVATSLASIQEQAKRRPRK